MENSAWKITKNQKHCRPNSWIQHDSGEIVLHLHWSDCKTWWCKTFKILLAFFFVWWQSKDLGKTAINGYYNIMKTGFVFANQKLLHFHLFMWKYYFFSSSFQRVCPRVSVCVQFPSSVSFTLYKYAASQNKTNQISVHGFVCARVHHFDSVIYLDNKRTHSICFHLIFVLVNLFEFYD